jgi:hypothetical protein
MQGNENKKTRIQTKRANKHNRLSCLISTSISCNSMCVSNYQNLRIYVVYKFVNCVVWFVRKGTYGSPLPLPSITDKKSEGSLPHLINRIYNKQQYNDLSVNCCKQPIKYLNPSNPIISYPYP